MREWKWYTWFNGVLTVVELQTLSSIIKALWAHDVNEVFVSSLFAVFFFVLWIMCGAHAQEVE